MLNRFTLFLALATSALAESNAWQFAQPNAKLLMGIDLKGLRESAAGQTLRSQWNAQTPPSGPAAMAVGFLDQVDRIFLSSPALPPAAGKSSAKPGAKTAAAAENPPFLLVVEGRLPLQQLLAFLPGTSHRYHDVDVFRGPKGGDANIAMLDAGTVVMGDEKSVLAAIDGRGHAAAPATALVKRAQDLAAAHELWMIVDASLSSFQPGGAGLGNPMAAQFASQIKGLDLALSVHDGFQADLGLTAESETVAGQLSQFVSLALLTQTGNPQAAEMAKKLQVATEGTRLRLRFALSSEEFAQQLRTAQASMAARGQAAREQAAPGKAPRTANLTPVAAQPKPATPGKIKIYGLDEGVREIPMTH